MHSALKEKSVQQWLPFGGVLLLSAILNFWNLANLGLTHFDEGAYTNAGRWLATFGNEGWIYQSGHAPGLYPTMVAFFFLLFGIRDFIAISVSASAGVLTVALTYFAGKHWFGKTAGLVAALFLATSEYHLIYSRLALTDATFSLFFWAAIAAYLHAMQTQEQKWFIWAGFLAGLCWNTKYHGFLPAFWAGVYLLGCFVFWQKGLEKAHMGHLKKYVLSILVMALVYLPWFLFVEITVGNQVIFEHLSGHSMGSGSLVVTSLDVLVWFLSRWLSPALLLAAVSGAVFCLTRRSVEGSYLLLVISGMLVAAMIYASFPRLLLPVVPGLCLLAATAVMALAAYGKTGRPLAAVMVCVVLLTNLIKSTDTLSQETTAYRQAAEELSGRAPVLTQMSKNYYFYDRNSIEMRWQKTASLDSLFDESRNLTVAIDPIIHRFPELQAWFGRRRPELELQSEISIVMPETNYYQGIDPRQLENISLARAPFRPGHSKIKIYRKKTDP